jgi:hypothetical protein
MINHPNLKKVTPSILALICLAWLLSAPLKAQGDPQQHADLAKKSQNPIASLISVPFESDINSGIGDTRRNQYSLLIKPVLPFHMAGGWNLISRTIFPILRNPVGLDESIWGLGDINPQFFFTPPPMGNLTVGIGPQFSLRTETTKGLGSGKWGAGPTFVLVATPGKFVAGFVTQNTWSIAGAEDREDVNAFLFQYFINFNIAEGWYLVSAPVLTADWTADSDQWVVPFGGGAGKIFRIGNQAINGQVSGYFNAVSQDAGPDYQFRATLNFLFPQ